MRVSKQVLIPYTKGMMKPCPECHGEGRIEYDLPRPQSFTRDIGYIDTIKTICDRCGGYCEVELDDDDIQEDKEGNLFILDKIPV